MSEITKFDAEQGDKIQITKTIITIEDKDQLEKRIYSDMGHIDERIIRLHDEITCLQATKVEFQSQLDQL